MKSSHTILSAVCRTASITTAVALLYTTTAVAQDRLKQMPGYDQYTRMLPQIVSAVKPGALIVNWIDSKSFEYTRDGKWYRFDVARRAASEITAPTSGLPTAGRGGRGGRGGGPERGRQVASMLSPDSTLNASYRDRNLFIGLAAGGNESAITTDGSEKLRIKYGTASWVYGEELAQTTAFWWAPGSKKLGYYRFDESQVPDFYLGLDQTKLQTKVDVEAYPKPGVPNPVVDLYVYDIATKKSVKMDVRDGRPNENATVGYYVYKIGWSPDGSEITFNRTNRRQNILEFTACDPDTGHCRVLVHDEWPTGWVENNPLQRFLAGNKRFIWESERNGYKNYYLYDMSGKLLNAITNNPFEAESIVRVDEATNTLFYMARDGNNHMKLQLHRVGLDGKGDRRLTDPAFLHTVTLAPDGKAFVDVIQTHDQAPATRLVDATGKVIAELAQSDLSKFEQLGLKKTEMFTYAAADGKTILHGLISFPSTFDPTMRYPVLVPVYGGPQSASNISHETFSPSLPATEYGFVVVNLDSRAVPGMGKRVADAIYEKLGQTEMDDMAAGIKSLWNRPYIDKARVGIYGTSYGGYSSLMELVRHPEVFAAASASSPPTDWRNYDTIYTERYMWIPQENTSGYDLGSAMTYADSLKGRLMLYFGTADNNVHPNNMMQMIQALQKAGKSFELQAGPDQGHSGINNQRMMEFFIENLVLRKSLIAS